MYGAIDMGFTDIMYKKNDVDTNGRKAFASSSNDTSRWGLTGVEDMGNGMKGSFKIEQGIGTNPRSGLAKNLANLNGTNQGTGASLDNTVVGDREFWIAVDSGNTNVKLGYGGTAMRTLALATDAAGTNNYGNQIAHELGAYRRAGVTLTQKMGAFTASVQASQNNDTQTTSEQKTGTGSNFGLTYAQGPLTLGYAYDVVKSVRLAYAHEAALGGSIAPMVALGDNSLAALDNKMTTSIVAGSYDLGSVKAFAQYYTVKMDDNTAVIAKGEGKKKGSSIGLQAPMGNLVPFVQIFNGTNSQSNKATFAGEDRKVKGYTVGTRYNLSKRTYAYVVTGNLKTDAGSNTTNFGDKAEYKQTSFGLVHAF